MESSPVIHALSRKRFSLFQLALLTFGLTAALVYIARVQQEAIRESAIELLRAQNAPQPDVMLAGPSLQSAETAYKGRYEFTDDWFTRHIPSWVEATAPWAGQPDVSYLEVGVYEGRAAMWMVENVLTHSSSELVVVDPFSGSYVDVNGPYEERYRNNLATSGFHGRATTIEGYSQIELRKLPLESYDIIYVDGSHFNDDVLEDAILVWRLLKSGGLLIFDDYGQPGLTDPRIGIDTFMRFFGQHFEVIHNDHQLMMRKR